MIVLAETLGAARRVRPHARLLRARRGAVRRERARPGARRRTRSSARVDLAVCLEPSDNKLHLGCCGSIHATVTFEGSTGAQRAAVGRRERDHKAAGLLDRLARARADRARRSTASLYRTVDDRDARERRARAQRRARRLHAEPEPPLRARHLARAGAGATSSARRRRARASSSPISRPRRCRTPRTRSCRRSSPPACAASSRSRRGPTWRASRRSASPP